MSMVKYRSGLLMEKSRSDDTLLTVDFNLRNRDDVRTLSSPVGTAGCGNKKNTELHPANGNSRAPDGKIINKKGNSAE